MNDCNIDLTKCSDDEVKSVLSLAKDEISARQKKKLESIFEDLNDVAAEGKTTVEELLLLMGYTKGKVKKKRTVRFVNPQDQEQTWAGVGKRPIWLNKLISEGADIEQFRIA